MAPNKLHGWNNLHTSVVNNQCQHVKYLLSSTIPNPHVDKPDHNGYTPLMLAIAQPCLECVEYLTSLSKPKKLVNTRTKETILHMAVKKDADEILKYLLKFKGCATLTTSSDANGMTPILLAIERKSNKCLEILINTKSINVTNRETKETVLHAAIRVDNRLALSKLLCLNALFTSWMIQRDADDNTPFWSSVLKGNKYFVMQFLKGGWVNIDEETKNGYSPIFVAAETGHLEVLKALLLSKHFYRFYKKNEKHDTVTLELFLNETTAINDFHQSRDIFILTSAVPPKNLHRRVPMEFLNSNNKKGRNIFHACALGENKNCLDFVCTLCSTFSDLSLLDSPDDDGVTPLMMAKNNDPYYVWKFISNGADISRQDKAGSIALNSVLNCKEESVYAIQQVFRNAIMFDKHVVEVQEGSENLQLDFSVFLPPNSTSVTKVVNLLFNSIKEPHRTEVLQEPLVKTYVNKLYVGVRYFFITRFVISLVTTALLMAYFDVKTELDSSYVLVQTLKYILLGLGSFGILFSIPVLPKETFSLISVIVGHLMILPCVFIIIVVSLPFDSLPTMAIAAVTCMLSFSSLLMYSTVIFRDISHQIAMLSQVMYGMMAYFFIFLVYLIVFSLAFCCIFHDNPYFHYLIQTIVYTTYVLLGGSFIVCVLGLVSMIVGLAVRDGKMLEAQGEVFQRHLQVHLIHNLEEFVKGRMYRILNQTIFIYFLGIIPSKTVFNIDFFHSLILESPLYPGLAHNNGLPS